MQEQVIQQRDAQVGDIVRCRRSPFGDACVIRISGGIVYLSRPYLYLYRYTDGSSEISSGVEEFSVFQNSHRTFILVDRPKVYVRPPAAEARVGTNM